MAPEDTQLREGSRRLKGYRWLRQAQGRFPLRHCGHRDLVILRVEGHPGHWGVEQPPWLLHVPGAPSPDEHRCPRWGLASPGGAVASLGTLLWDLAERWDGRLAKVMAPPPTPDSAVSPCFHGCQAFLHRHFAQQSPPSYPLDLSLCSQQQPLPWDCSTIPKFQLLAAVPSRRPASLSGVCMAVARTSDSDSI